MANLLFESKFKIKTDAGIAGVHGVKVSIELAPDFPLGGLGGSGEIISPPGFSILHEMAGKKSAFLSIDASSPEAAVEIAKQGLELNKVGVTGDAILLREGKRLMTFNNFDCRYEVSKAKAVWNFGRKLVELSVAYTWFNTSNSEKWTSFMLKGCNVNVQVNCFDKDGNPVPQANGIVTLEGFKDANVIKAAGEAEHRGIDFVLDCSTGSVGADDPAFKDLVESAEKRMVERTYVRWVETHWYEMYRGRFGDRKDLVFFDDGHTISWTGMVLPMDIIVSIEYSPTCLSVGKTNLMLEMLLLMDSVQPELADYYRNDKKSRARRGLINATFGMAENVIPAGMTMKKDMAKSPIKLNPNQSDEALLKELLAIVRIDAKAYEAAHPGETANKQGIILTYDKHTQYIDVDALLRGGQFGEDEKGYTISGALCDLLRFSANSKNGENETSKFSSLFRLLRKGFESYLLNSRKPMASAARAAGMETRKVLTADFIPYGELWLNPNDPLAAKYLEGKRCFGARIPVQFLFVATVRLMDCVPMGKVLVCSLLWHEGNEGDADGDAIAMLLIPDQFADEAQKRWADPKYRWLTTGGYKGIRFPKGAQP